MATGYNSVDVTTRGDGRSGVVFWLSAAVAALFGLVLLLLAVEWDWLKSHATAQTLLREVGALTFVSVALTIVWETWGKRTVFDEVFTKTRLLQSVNDAGLIQLHADFSEVDWDHFFEGTRRFDVFFAGGHSWRGTRARRHLLDLAGRKGVRVRVILPNPEIPWLVATLAERFKSPPEKVQDRIRDAAEDFKSVFHDSQASLGIWYHARDLLFSFYISDRYAVFAPYTHRSQRISDLPALMCRTGGFLVDFLENDVEYLIGSPSSPSKKVWPEDPPQEANHEPAAR